jgi:hypothetical protein
MTSPTLILGGRRGAARNGSPDATGWGCCALAAKLIRSESGQHRKPSRHRRETDGNHRAGGVGAPPASMKDQA